MVDKEANWEQLKTFLNRVDTVLDEDLPGLRRTPGPTLDRWWRNISDGWDWYVEEGKPVLDVDDALNKRIRSKVKLAQLLISKATGKDGADRLGVAAAFSDTELALVEEFEQYKRLDVLSEKQLVENVEPARWWSVRACCGLQPFDA